MSPVCLAPTPGFAPTPGTIADQLRQRLLALDYPSFARCACKLLEALGYEEARPAGRQEWKGYNRPGGGGYDLEAVLPGGLAPRRVVIQLKQYDAPTIHQRNVDELRGACLRAGGAEAVLITTSSFSKVVRSSQASGSQVPGPANGPGVPVRLIDGRELLNLLIRYRLGVRECNQGGTRRLEIDEAFFRGLVAFDKNMARRNPAKRGTLAKRRKPVTGNGIMTGNTATTGTISTSTAGTISTPTARVPQESTSPSQWRVTIHISSDFGLISVGLDPRIQTNDQAGDGLPGDGLPGELAEGGR